MGRRRSRRWLLGMSAAWLLALAPPAAGGGPTCVTGCVDKTDACAGTVHRLISMDPRASQLGCAQALFVGCVARCQESNIIVWNDYRVVVPGSRAAAVRGGRAPGVAGRERAGLGYGARR